MKPFARWLLSVCMVPLMLAAGAVPGHAATSRYVRVDNVASGGGICSITIESFGLLVAKQPESQSILSFTANVPIPALSTPANSAILIRNGLIGVLPLGYSVTVDAGSPNFVHIVRSTGTFTIGILDDVPTQNYIEDNVTLPNLDAPGLAIVGSLLLGCALLALRARRPRPVRDGASRLE